MSMVQDKTGDHCLNDHERRKEDRDAQRQETFIRQKILYAG